MEPLTYKTGFGNFVVLPPEIIFKITSLLDLVSLYSFGWSSKILSLYATNWRGISKITRIVSTNFGIFAASHGYTELLKWAASHGWSPVHVLVDKITPVPTYMFPYCDSIIDEFEIALLYNKLDTAKWISANFPVRRTEAYTYAIGGSANDCIKWLFVNDYPKNSKNITMACRMGLFILTEWLIEMNFPIADDSYLAAISSNRKDLVKLLFRNNVPIHHESCIVAVLMDRLDILQWIYEHSPDSIDSEECLFSAISVANLNTLDWLYAKYTYDVEEIGRFAIIVGTADVLNWAISKGFSTEHNNPVHISQSNDTSTVKLLKKRGFAFDHRNYYSSAKRGCVSNARYMRRYINVLDE